mmetsp:Transcript_21013/g.58456  ORF Transcript_21013/g.58456 Transcript_21013/m.58456 type:complete len:225 (-) Transcript_21013:66-740(-)
MRDGVDHLGDLGRDADDAVLVSDDGVTGSHDGTREAHDAVAFPWLHGGRSLTRGGGVREARETVVDDLVGVAHAAVRDESADGELLQSQELDVAADGFPWSGAGHDEDFVWSALLEGLVLWRFASGWLVLGNVGTGWDEVEGDGTSDALHAWCEGTGTIDLGSWPSHDPEAIDEGLRGEGSELLERLIGDGTSAGGSHGEGALGDARGLHQGGSSACEGGGEHD